MRCNCLVHRCDSHAENDTIVLASFSKHDDNERANEDNETIMSDKADQVPADKLELYKRLIDSHPEIELKGGMKLPYTSYQGNMFSQLTKAGVVGLRLGKNERQAFIAAYDSGLLETYGTVMKEYVAVPDQLLHDTKKLLPYLEQSYAYAKTLKPKPSKRKT